MIEPAEPPINLEMLSLRKQQLLTLLSQGHTNKEIAATLKISDQTVKNHLMALFKKLQVRSRVEAVLLAQPATELSPEVTAKLSARERGVVTHLVQGLSTKEIASRLKISQSTLRYSLKSLCRKLHVHNRIEIIAAVRYPFSEEGESDSSVDLFPVREAFHMQ